MEKLAQRDGKLGLALTSLRKLIRVRILPSFLLHARAKAVFRKSNSQMSSSNETASMSSSTS